MKIYIVFEHDWDDSKRIFIVVDSEEKAEQAVDNKHYRWYEEFYVE